jgi:predicted O-methyltransferase YrrM
MVKKASPFLNRKTNKIESIKFTKSAPEIGRYLENLYLNSNWRKLYYSVIDQLILMSKPKTILEIGVAYGLHAKHLTNKFPEIHYTGVDPYLAGYSSYDLFADEVHNLMKAANPQTSLDQLYELVFAEFAEMKNVSIVREKSETFLRKTNRDKRKFDLIFVDGDHSEKQVLKDLLGSWEVLNDHGVLCGDDYSWDSVKMAVNKFCKKKNLDLHFASNFRNYNVFFFYKK